jgi:AraC family transcriptional regulator
MLSITLVGGLYAVFEYKNSRSDTSIYNCIYSEWISAPEYELDYTPHFKVIGEKYKNNDLNSEEQIWIPIKLL